MIETKQINIFKVKLNPNNPRTFSKTAIEQMVNSILCFPEMLDGIRAIAIKDFIILGGNLRQKALKTIESYELTTISQLIAKHSKDKSEKRVNYLVDYWSEFKQNKTITYIIADNLTDDQAKEFLIRDNVNIGSWDMDILANNWDSELLNDWGLNVWNGEEDEKEKLENTEKEIAPFNEVHILLSFHPDLFNSVKDYMEKIQSIEGVSYEQSAN